VAVDVARILCKTVDELKNTDITARALEVLAESRVREVRMIGRRGPVQAAFTPPEMKELGEFGDCDLVVDPAELELNDASRAELEVLKWREAQKNYALLRQAAATAAESKSRTLRIQFYRGPKELVGGPRLNGVVLERNSLSGEPGSQKAVGTGVTELVPCGVLFRSVGYRGVPLAGVPFDEKNGIIPNVEGRVVEKGQPLSGLYVAGWIKRGPSGIIGTNKPDSFETVKSLLADVPSLTRCADPSRDALVAFLRGRGVRIVNYEDWRRIDAAEVERGAPIGKPREKFTSIDEMLGVVQPR
jgi:ferredoxin--NADP+ reductase